MAQNQTAVQEHMVVVELEDGETGYRWWSAPMSDDEASAYIKTAETRGDFLSELSCSASCPAC
jgi:hypothetical protein